MMKSVTKSLILSITFVLLFISVQAQEQQEVQKIVNQKLQFWTSINSTLRFSDHWGMVADVHIRRDNFIQDPNFYFLRTGGAWWFNDQFSFVLGIAALWLATETDVGIKYALERRIYQQALWRTVIGRTTFLQRIRIEQRWHQVLNTDDGSVNRVRFSNRFRFLMSAAIKAFNNPKAPKPVISNEILFHVGSEILYNTFDQNRFFIGLNQRLGRDWTMDFGYMLVYQQLYSGYEYDMNHTVRVFFYWTPDFRKKADEEMPHYPVGGLE
jgi:hypothetical protein